MSSPAPRPAGRGAGFQRSGTRIAEPVTGGTRTLNWFNLAFIGWVILIAAIAIAAYMLHAPVVWIAIGALALLGIGIITSVSKSKPQI